MQDSKTILRESVRSFARNFKYILLLLLIVSLPAALLQACVVDARFDMAGVLTVIEQATEQYEADPSAVPDSILSAASFKMMLYFALTTLISTLSVLIHMGIMLLCRDDRQGVRICFRDIFEESLRLFPKVWLTQLLSSLLIAIGLMFCFIPGILMAYVFYMVPYAVVYTGFWGRKGLYVASLYTRKRGLVVLLLIVAGFAFSYISGFGINLLLQFLPEQTGVIEMMVNTLFYCIRDLLACIPVVFISGFALSILDELDLSALNCPKKL